MVWKMFKTKDMIVRQDNRHGLENIQNKRHDCVRHVFINNFQLTNKNHPFKEIVCVISFDPPCKHDSNAR